MEPSVPLFFTPYTATMSGEGRAQVEKTYFMPIVGIPLEAMGIPLEAMGIPLEAMGIPLIEEVMGIPPMLMPLML